MKNRIIFISYYFPPIQSVGCIRNYYFANEAKSVFEEVEVITTNNVSIFPKQELPISDIPIHPVSTFDYRTLYCHLSKQQILHHKEESKKHPILRFLLKLNETFPFSFPLGEGGLLYIWSGYRKAIELVLYKKDTTTHCFSSFRVAGNHIVSCLLKRKFPDLIWIADFHDLPYDSLRKNAFFPRLQSWFWKRILKNADKVITVSQGLANTLQKWHPNVEVIRDGIVERKTLLEVDRKNFIINYTGSIYRGVQNADALWNVLKELTETNINFSTCLKIRYAGKDSSLFAEWLKKYNLDKYMEDNGLVSREKAMQMQETASVNLLLTWSFGDSKGIVTGKIYEYLSARRPILLLINGERDEEMEAWFEEMECGEVCYNLEAKQSEIHQFILKYFEKWLSNENILVGHQNFDTKFSWESKVLQALTNI